ncbi:putative proline--tRNA ligase, mitochondrial [Aphelenchoides bicaudatus]|nr:putative proline--tRNA ligase, mitochondrial [Aphelenchoides bicaudatus]
MAVDYASRLLFKVTPVDKSKAKCLSHALLLANNLIHQTGKGTFAILPIGQKIVDKLTKLVENELHEIGAQKCSLPAIGFENVWKRSGRWDVYGSGLFRFKDRLNNQACLQPTCEEMISNFAAQFGTFKAASLPMMLFQSTDKFRDEMNPRFGLLRSRQFIMNDLYSFDEDKQNANNTYQRISEIYRRIFFDHLKLNETMIVKASAGEMGGDLSHEYHLPNESAEDRLLHCENCRTTLQTENSNAEKCPDCNTDLKSINSVEVGHTFQLGQHYSSMFEALDANRSPYFMCCFGLGISRLIAASIDTLTISDKAMRLPKVISPYKLAIVVPKVDGEHYAAKFTHDLIANFNSLPNLNGDILVDDRLSKSVGRRLIELNQLGVPNIVVVSAKKSANPHDLVEMELFRANPKEEDLKLVGMFTHSALMDFSRTF